MVGWVAARAAVCCSAAKDAAVASWENPCTPKEYTLRLEEDIGYGMGCKKKVPHTRTWGGLTGGGTQTMALHDQGRGGIELGQELGVDVLPADVHPVKALLLVVGQTAVEAPHGRPGATSR